MPSPSSCSPPSGAPPRAAAQVSDSQPPPTGTAPANDTAIRSFHITVPQEALDDFRRRNAATRWPDRELVTDLSQGVKLAKLQELVRYWGTAYDWRKAKAQLNALPQFVTKK